jgi:hypothetical protein
MEGVQVSRRPIDLTVRESMPFSESLAARTRDALARERNITEKKMFGGLCFMLNGKLFVGGFQDSLLVRLGQEGARAALSKLHVGKMEMAGRPMKGWVIVEPDGIDSDKHLNEWVQKAIEFVVTLT